MTTGPIAPDTKDWTWVLREQCSECGLDAGSVPPLEVADRLRASAATWPAVLARPDVAVRPSPGTWSALEYGAHVRDVHRTTVERVRLMLGQDDPVFTNWDQDATAVADRYGEQDPATVAAELLAAAEEAAAVLDGVTGDVWQRPGRRSNGSVFTVATLAQYVLHDVVHHEVDVRR